MDLIYDFKASKGSSYNDILKSKILALYDASVEYQKAHIVIFLTSMTLVNFTFLIFIYIDLIKNLLYQYSHTVM